MILFYDEDCVLCKRFKQGLELLDREKKITFRSIYDEKVYEEFPQLKFDECEADVHLIHAGQVYRGGEVIEQLITILPGVKKFSWLIEKESAKTAIDAFYGQISDMRAMQRKKCFRCGTRSQKRRVRQYQEREL